VDTLSRCSIQPQESLKRVYRLDFVDSSFIQIHAIVPQEPQNIYIGINAEIGVTEYWERTHKFLGIKYGKKTYHTDLSTNNPYIKISNAKSVKMAPKPHLELKTGIGVGVNYDPISKTFHPGVQIGLYLIRSR
jgi:hypothetical protein